MSSLKTKENRQTLRLRVQRSVDTLSQHISQRQLELLLGLSRGYLSRLRSGSGTPSPTLVGNLALIAIDPKARLIELDRYWAAQTAAVTTSNQTRARPGQTRAQWESGHIGGSNDGD